MHISDCVKDAIFAKGLLKYLGERFEPAFLYADNMGAIKGTKKVLHGSKNVTLQASFLRIYIARNFILVTNFSGDRQLADVLTKSPFSDVKIPLRDRLGVCIIRNGY